MEHPFFSDEPLVRPSTEHSEEIKPNKYFEREYINSFKEDVVKDIFTTVLRRSGDEAVMSKFIPFKDIQLVRGEREKAHNEMLTQKSEEGRQEGAYDLLTKKLLVDTVFVKRESVEATRSAALGVILHEELHALTHKEIDGKDHMQVGLEEVFVSNGIPAKSWTDFNEGMTEIIMDDLFEEYLRRTGDRKDFTIRDYKDGVVNSSYQAYFYERMFVNSIFMSISKDLGIPLDVVREAFAQAYISGMLQDQILKDLRGLSNMNIVRKIGEGVQIKKETSPQEEAPKIELSNEERKRREEEGREIIKIMCSNYMKKSFV
jgi:hypothetical protein